MNCRYNKLAASMHCMSSNKYPETWMAEVHLKGHSFNLARQVTAKYKAHLPFAKLPESWCCNRNGSGVQGCDHWWWTEVSHDTHSKQQDWMPATNLDKTILYTPTTHNPPTALLNKTLPKYLTICSTWWFFASQKDPKGCKQSIMLPSWPDTR